MTSRKHADQPQDRCRWQSDEQPGTEDAGRDRSGTEQEGRTPADIPPAEARPRQIAEKLGDGQDRHRRLGTDRERQHGKQQQGTAEARRTRDGRRQPAANQQNDPVPYHSL